MKLDLPLYNIMPPSEEDTGLLLVSFVEDPAIEIDFLKFSKEHIFNFSTNEEQRIITGPAILADTPIYRRNGDYEFYVKFSKETIKALVEKFMREGLNNFIDIEHDQTSITDKKAVLVESYFVNKDRGICPNEYKDLPEGSWITSYKILDDELWNFIKQNGAKGFSIEITCDIEPAREYSKQPLEDEYDEIIEIFNLKKESKPEANPGIEPIKNIEEKIEQDTALLNTFNPYSVQYAIDNKKWCMIRYTNNSATSYRQCAVTAMGMTSAGNQAIFVYQTSGASESKRYDYKLLLSASEISDFQVLAGMPSWTSSEIGYDGIHTILDNAYAASV